MSRMPRFLRHRAPVLVIGSVLLATSACSGSHGHSSSPSPSAAAQGSTDKSGTTSGADNAAAVSAGYNGYAKAVTAKTGSAVVNSVSQASLNYMDRLRDLALTATVKDLDQESPVPQLTVLTMRATIDPAQLRKATPAQLITTAVQTGLITPPTAQGLKHIKVSGQVATAEVTMPGSSQKYPVYLHLENGQWKYDLSSLLGPAESALTGSKDKMKDRNNQPALVKSVLVARFGKAKTEQLYKPLGK